MRMRHEKLAAEEEELHLRVSEQATRASHLESAARGTQNLLVPMKTALAAMATLGEVSDVLREEFGVYQPGG